MELCGLGSRRERHGIEVHGIGRAPVKFGMRASGIEEVDVASETDARALLRTTIPNIPDTADPAVPMQTVSSCEARMSEKGW